MQNLSAPWQQLLKNFGLYIILLAIVMTTFFFFKLAWLLLLMWVVGLGGIIALSIQFARLSFGSQRETIHAEAQMQYYFELAEGYKAKITQAIRSTKAERASAVQQQQLERQVNVWTESIINLIDRVNRLRQDNLIQQDLQHVPKAVADLEKQLAAEKDDFVRKQLERTLTNRRQQLEALKDIKNTIRRAEFEIESTISRLGTIYSTLLAKQSDDQVATYNRLSEDIDEEVFRLRDHLEALREVRLGDDS